jgi:pimeloyl-ACP methyl ester carboxylesterase
VLEPLQTAASVEGQIEELREVLEEHATGPVTLIGWSWGAMLGFMLAARAPELVRKLILVASGPYEAQYATGIDQTRLSRLSQEERQRIQDLVEAMNDPAVEDKSPFLAELGALFGKADDYDPIAVDSEELGVQFDIFEQVWSEVVELRASGALLELGKRIRCPVMAIHGDYDPHPAEGIREPLARTLENFRFVLLDRCGHTPWLERHVRDEFYRILRAEIGERASV